MSFRDHLSRLLSLYYFIKDFNEVMNFTELSNIYETNLNDETPSPILTPNSVLEYTLYNTNNYIDFPPVYFQNYTP